MRKVIIAAAFVATPVLQTSAEPTHSYLTNKNHLYVGTFSQTMDANILAQRDGFDPVSVGI